MHKKAVEMIQKGTSSPEKQQKSPYKLSSIRSRLEDRKSGKKPKTTHSYIIKYSEADNSLKVKQGDKSFVKAESSPDAMFDLDNSFDVKTEDADESTLY